MRTLTARNARRLEAKRRGKLLGVIDQIRAQIAKCPPGQVVLRVPDVADGQTTRFTPKGRAVPPGDYALTKVTGGVADWRVFGRHGGHEIDLTSVVLAGGVTITRI